MRSLMWINFFPQLNITKKGNVKSEINFISQVEVTKHISILFRICAGVKRKRIFCVKNFIPATPCFLALLTLYTLFLQSQSSYSIFLPELSHTFQLSRCDCNKNQNAISLTYFSLQLFFIAMTFLQTVSDLFKSVFHAIILNCFIFMQLCAKNE